MDPVTDAERIAKLRELREQVQGHYDYCADKDVSWQVRVEIVAQGGVRGCYVRLIEGIDAILDEPYSQ